MVKEWHIHCFKTINGFRWLSRIKSDEVKQFHAKTARFGCVFEFRVLRQLGFNALDGEYIDMIQAGIVDPAKVTRSALQNAASIAAMVLTTETLVADKPEKADPAAAAGAAGMGGGMGMPGMM